MSKVDDLKAALEGVLDKIRESEAYGQIKGKWDELDDKTKLYAKLGSAAVVVLMIFGSVLSGMIAISSIKSDIDSKEALIGYLNQSADTLRQLKEMQAASQGAANLNGALDAFVGDTIENSGVDREKATISAEAPGDEDKTTKEVKVDVKVSQVNLRQLTKILFNLVDQGSAKGVNILNLDVKAKEDFSGWLDMGFTVSMYRAK